MYMLFGVNSSADHKNSAFRKFINSNKMINSKIKIHSLVILVFYFGCTFGLIGQPVSQLIKHYTGTVTWDPASGSIEFLQSGSIKFEKPDQKFFIWDVPDDVKQIVIKADVTVNGAFHTYSDILIKGENRKTSVLFGTEERRWSKNRREEGYSGLFAYNYSTIEAKAGTAHIQNLTSLNPWGFHVRGGLLHVSHCDFIDNRGGHGNNSDGIAGASGTTVDNCYFKTADDIIKVYNDITVTNTTIHMIDNTVPIQLGWSNTGDATGTFINLTITGESGRYNDNNAIIAAHDGIYTKTINIYDSNIENPTASWLSLRVPGQIVKGEVKNTRISLKSFWSRFKEGENHMIIYGDIDESNLYDCSEK
jgi:hypothetical protein